jgi:endoglucanase
MPTRLHWLRRRPIAMAVTAAACLAAAGTALTMSSASAGTLSGSLYRDPNGASVRWVAANPNDSRMPQIRDRIASQPASRWFTNPDLTTTQTDVSTYINAANAANQVPVMSLYAIPNRDCGGASAGGATTMTQYQQWISTIAQRLGNRLVVIILETDSIALQTCLNASDLAARNQALTSAVQTLKSGNASAKVYLDGGHSAWNSAGDQANRLRAAGIQFADGFYTNVSNFQSTGNETNYGANIISSLNAAGVTGKRQIIDTSRNGGAAGDWCADDNTDRRIGTYPTLNTGNANIDGLLWIKPPGEADGCAFTAGSFQASLAFSLSTGVANPPSTTPPVTTPPVTTPPVTTPPVTTPPVTTPPVTTPPVTTPPVTGACSATYKTVNAWSGGFQAEVTVKAGNAAINSWTVAWTLASGQTITQLWNGALTTSGSNVTVKNLSYNGSLAANATTTFGFLGAPNASNPTLTCTSP